MTKITAEHLGRSAYVYIRQSTADQLHNHESRRRQYALAIVLVSSVGRTSSSLTTILAAPVAEPLDPGSIA